ncbi:MAG: LysE family translocator [Microlunatus sp.]
MGLEFWVTSIVVTATPGTGALFTIAAGMSRGVRAGLVAALGCTLGIVPHLALALTGAAAILAASPVAFEAIRWLGVAYLLYLAWGMWRQARALTSDMDGDQESASLPARKVIFSAVLVNLLNPKLTIFFFVFLPIFVHPDADGAALRMAALGLVFMGITAVIFAGYGVCAAWLRRYVIGRPVVMRWLDRGFAVIFVVLAAMLAVTRG